MTAGSRARASCAGDTVYDRKAAVFPYSWSWKRGDLTYTVQRGGLRCRDMTGHGFFLSKTRSYAF